MKVKIGNVLKGEQTIIHQNTGNQYAKKETPKDSHIHIRCKQSDKALIVRNRNDSEKLSDFMLRLALDEAARRQANR